MSSSKPESDAARALARATRYVRTGVRSTEDVRLHLRRQGLSPAIIEPIVARLCAQGLLDDRICARLWAEQWARRGYGWAAIRTKLVAKGLDEDALAEAQRRVEVPGADAARARVVTARWRRPGGGRRERARLARTLASRGFDAELIDQVLIESFGSLTRHDHES